MKRKNNYTMSSGNIFADLGFPNPEEMLAKAELARQINNLIKQKKLTQIAAAELLGIDQPKISLLGKGRLSGFSLERLFRFLNILDQDIIIKITSKARSKKKADVSVSFPKTKKSPIIKPPSVTSNPLAIQAQKKK